MTHYRYAALLIFLLTFTDHISAQTQRRVYPLTDEKILTAHIKLGAVRLKLSAHDAKNVFDYQYTSAITNEVKYSYELSSGEGDLTISNLKGKEEGRNKMLIRWRDLFNSSNDSDTDNDEEVPIMILSLTNSLPINLMVTLGAGEQELNLAGLKLSSLTLKSGGCKTDVNFKTPNSESIQKLRIAAGASQIDVQGIGNANCAELSLQGGASDVRLNYNGELRQTIKNRITLGAGALHIEVPKEASVRIQYEENIFSSFQVPESFVKKSDGYCSPNYNAANHSIDFKISSGMGSVEVETK
jgi:hypothetical protein